MRARKEILDMEGYSSARSLQNHDTKKIFLDANECAFDPFLGGDNLSRYPDKQPKILQNSLCHWLDVSSRNITITRGADEAIECLIRAFCIPSIDNIIICPPTFPMYAQSAKLHSIEVREAELDRHFDLNLNAIDKRFTEKPKLFLYAHPITQLEFDEL